MATAAASVLSCQLRSASTADEFSMAERSDKTVDYLARQLSNASSLSNVHRLPVLAEAPTCALQAAGLDVSKGTTTLAFRFKQGVMLAVDSRASHGTYVASSSCEKVVKINDYLLGTIAGGAADCKYWQRVLAVHARMYELRNSRRMPVSTAAQVLASFMYQYRGRGLSCGMMLVGWDPIGEDQGGKVFMVDDSGDRIPGNIFSVGSGSPYAYGVLDQNYRHDMTVEEATQLAREAIVYATHRDGSSGGVVRVFHMHSKGWTCKIEGEDVTKELRELQAAK